MRTGKIWENFSLIFKYFLHHSGLCPGPLLLHTCFISILPNTTLPILHFNTTSQYNKGSKLQSAQYYSILLNTTNTTRGNLQMKSSSVRAKPVPRLAQSMANLKPCLARAGPYPSCLYPGPTRVLPWPCPSLVRV